MGILGQTSVSRVIFIYIVTDARCVTGYWLLVTGYWLRLRATYLLSTKSLIVDCWPLIADYGYICIHLSSDSES